MNAVTDMNVSNPEIIFNPWCVHGQEVLIYSLRARTYVHGGAYADIPGFCKSATTKEIRKHGHVLTPGRYVGAEDAETDDESFEERMNRLAAILREQTTEGVRLDCAIALNLKELGYAG